MDYMIVISAIVLGLSVLATIAKFLDWFLHSNPRTMVRTTRWMLLLLLLACLPLLAVTIADQQWSAAMLVGAGMLILALLLNWRAVLAPINSAFGIFGARPRLFDMEVRDFHAAEDPETVRRAAAILDAYLRRSAVVALEKQRAMSPDEAFEVLGLQPGADDAAIRAACLRLLARVHPDHGGSAWLTRKIHQARDVLLATSQVTTEQEPGRTSRTAQG
jgi:hypothetical protein